jgi:branched-chain amino acid transport system substrate-binding protein
VKRLLLIAAAGFAASCSFITATGFSDCETDSNCGNEQVCLEKYCINMATGCRRLTGEFASNNRVVFAATLPLSSMPDGGVVDQSEQQGLNALALAVEEGNLRDGIKGKKFALLFCNTGGDDALAKQQVQWLATEMKVPAVVTSGSGQTIAITNVAAMKDVMVMSATSTSPELIGTFQSNKQLVWRTAPSDSLQARVMADLIEADYPAATDGGVTAPTRIGIVYVNTTYGQGLSAGLRARLPTRFEVKELPYELNMDISQAINDLNAFAPKLTMVVGFPPDIRAMVNLAKSKAALSRASGHRWLFSDSAKDPALLIDGTLAELAGSVGTAPAQGAGATFPSFKDRFVSKFAADPASFSFTSHSYDAMYLLMLSAAWATGGNSDAGITGLAMADGMRHVSSGAAFSLAPNNFTGAVTAMQAGMSIDVEGASGKLNYDLDAGAPSSPYELWLIEADGGLSTTRLVEPTGL